MKFDIHPEVVAKVTCCVHHHACLEEDGEVFCNIESTVNGTVFFVDRKMATHCPYQSSFGNAFHCTCPVRQEIYWKYKV
ncbi:MAG: hypothetical protein K9M45_03140 [Kiritimatiellales bacterium]|nr:hypothetical protein [Kiritimatiellales bacterium]